MISLSNAEEKILSSNVYIADSDSLDASKLIPISFGGRLANELGKQLLKAASDGESNEIRRLLNEGAPFAADWLGTSPLHLAAQGNHLEVCEVLLRSGIATNARTKVDRTPLHMASCEGHVDIVELLLREDTEVDCTDLLGMTPLHWAVQNGHISVVELLLRSGANRDSVNKFGLKPIDIAHQIDRLDIVELLEEMQMDDPTIATENLAIEMATDDDILTQKQQSHSEEIADDLEESQSQFDEDIQKIEINTNEQMHNVDSLSDSMKILQEHGITLLPADDDNNILTTVMESGHQVVLTDVGKQLLESVKASEEDSLTNMTKNLEKNNYITVTADQLLALAADNSMMKEQVPILRQVSGKLVPKTIKRIVMKKNKLQPVSPVPNILKQKTFNQPIKIIQFNQSLPSANEELENIKKQLAEAQKTIEDYKQRLSQKEAEAERYRKQLNMLVFS